MMNSTFLLKKPLTELSSKARMLICRILGLIYIAIIATPNILFYFGLSTSFALGTIFICCISISCIFLLKKSSPTSILWKINRSTSIVIITSTILIHFIFASLIQKTDIERFSLSIIFLILFIMAASDIAYILEILSIKAIKKSALVVFAGMGIAMLVSITGFSPSGKNATAKAIFPFVEPSHFAIFFLPLLISISVISSKSIKLIIIIVSLIISIYIQSFAMLIGVFITTVICINIKFTITLLFAISAIALNLDISYFSERIDISINSNNLSALVLLQGWQLIWKSLIETTGLGLGFQQMGLNEIESPASMRIYELLGKPQNIKDGGFLLSKIISEFGIIGIIGVLIYLKFLYEIFLRLRQIAQSKNNELFTIVVSYSYIVSFSVELFIRGSGYFTPSTLITAAAVIYIHRMKLSSLKKEDKCHS